MCYLKILRPYRCTHPDCTAVLPSRRIYAKCFAIESRQLPWGSCPGTSAAYETRKADTPRAEQAQSHLRCTACAARARQRAAKTRAQLGEWMEGVEMGLCAEPSRRPALEEVLGVKAMMKREEAAVEGEDMGDDGVEVVGVRVRGVKKEGLKGEEEGLEEGELMMLEPTKNEWEVEKREGMDEEKPKTKEWKTEKLEEVVLEEEGLREEELVEGKLMKLEPKMEEWKTEMLEQECLEEEKLVKLELQGEDDEEEKKVDREEWKQEIKEEVTKEVMKEELMKGKVMKEEVKCEGKEEDEEDKKWW